MIEREIHLNDTHWHCVQAFTGGVSEELQAKVAEGKTSVEVVCTPSGGAQTVRFQASPDWAERMSDDELKKRISAG